MTSPMSPPAPPHQPHPASPDGEAAFMAELRRLKAWSGLSYRELERAAAAAGEVLPYSTAATMLRRDRLPREAVLVAYLAACGLGVDDTRRWVAARRELVAAPRPPAPAAERPLPPVRDGRQRQRQWKRPRLAVVGLAAAVALLVGGSVVATGATTVQEEQQTVGTAGLPSRLPAPALIRPADTPG
ncbi:hypothetical protein DEJ49_03295 [Streptomyces venezuelae]|uniref:XRE family transcriptional regulator n=1 Tax=Streptomyces venezuelae TaxID=54571 RepID=A0A5P2CFP6_STRVZ|nr:hypothetical protein [Streptomyces venezuelae]QES40131.1 hypothetical protein DEJ49_03295 [Streptomyces venezuelae]